MQSLCHISCESITPNRVVLYVNAWRQAVAMKKNEHNTKTMEHMEKETNGIDLYRHH